MSISGASTNKFILFFILVILFSLIKIKAQGNLELMPMRVVFEGQNKIVSLSIANTGKDTATYAISMMEIRMKEDGSFERIEQPDSGQRFASSFIRFFPRSVTLAPLEAQVVKIQLIKTNQLVPGEYRSHIYFRAVPLETPLGEAEPLKDTSTISVHLVAVFGMSIPVIIRVGESTTEVSLSNTTFEIQKDNTPVLNMVFNRTGNMSVYGDLKIDFISALGKVTQVGEIKGIAVYTPILSRKVKVALDNTAGIDYKAGKLHVVYTTAKESKSVKMAETELELNEMKVNR